MKNRKRLNPIISYLIVWLVMVVIFWVGGSLDPLGFSIVSFYIVLPITTLIISFLVGKDKGRSNMKWLLTTFFGVMYMLANYTTFNLANMMWFRKFNYPDWDMILPGLIISAIGMAVGFIYSRKKLTNGGQNG